MNMSTLPFVAIFAQWDKFHVKGFSFFLLNR